MEERGRLDDVRADRGDAGRMPRPLGRDEAPDRLAPAPERKPARTADSDAASRGGEPGEADGGEKGGGGKDGGGKDGGGKRRSPLVWIILGIVVVIAAAGAAWYFIATANLVSTDDAYTDGIAVTIAPQVAGQVVRLAVRDNQFVHRGDVLIEIDHRNFQAAVDNAEAQLENARGQLDGARYGAAVARKNFPAALALAQAQLLDAQGTLLRARTEADRQHRLPAGATTRQAVDDADAALIQAQAQVKEADARIQEAEPVQQNIGQSDSRVSQLDGEVRAAQAQLDQARLNLDWSTVRAPQDGWVTQRTVDAGNYVQPGQAIMTLVTPKVWVTANFKETQLNRLRPGQKVSFSVDAYPGLHLRGHVDSVQLGSGSRFSAFPAENATGNFVKIVQRVPVKLDIDSGLDPDRPLPLGISVVPTVTVR